MPRRRPYRPSEESYFWIKSDSDTRQLTGIRHVPSPQSVGFLLFRSKCGERDHKRASDCIEICQEKDEEGAMNPR